MKGEHQSLKDPEKPYQQLHTVPTDSSIALSEEIENQLEWLALDNCCVKELALAVIIQSAFELDLSFSWDNLNPEQIIVTEISYNTNQD